MMCASEPARQEGGAVPHVVLLAAIRRALAPALPVAAGLALAVAQAPAAAAGLPPVTGPVPRTGTAPATGTATGTAPPGTRLSFQVSTTADGHDAHPGDGRCADRAGRCTLRAAVEEAAAQPPGTAVSIGLPAGSYGLRLGSLDVDGRARPATSARSRCKCPLTRPAAGQPRGHTRGPRH